LYLYLFLSDPPDSSCTEMGVTADESSVTNALDLIVDVMLALSLFGCTATVLTFVIFNEMRTYPIKLIIYLCCSIFLAQLFLYLTFYLENTILCIPCAMLLHFFFLADFLWTFCVAFNFYQMIVRRNRDAETIEKIYHMVSWLVPLLIVCFVAGFKSYINRGGYCYMKPGWPIFLSFFLPGLVIVSANAVIFFFIAREIHDTLKSAPKADKKEKSKEFRVYFSIFVSIGLSWIFGFVSTLLSDYPIPQVITLVLFSILTPLQGFLIFISYCVNGKVAGQWAALGGKFFPFLRRFENLGTSATSSTSASSSRIESNSSRNNNSNTSQSLANSRIDSRSSLNSSASHISSSTAE